MIGKRPVDAFVVGIDDDAANRVQKTRVVFVRQIAMPAIFAQPALRWQAPLALMPGRAVGHLADHLKRYGGPIRQGQVLRRAGVEPPGLDRRINGLRPHDPQGRRHRPVHRIKPGPGQRGDMPLRRDPAEIIARRRQDRAVFGPTQHPAHGVGLIDADLYLTGIKGFIAFGRQIFIGIVRVQLFDMQILVVQKRRRDPPAQLIRSPDQHRRHARNGAANDIPTGQFQPRQHPDDRG